MKKNFEIIDDEAFIKINKNIYTKEVIIQAVYVLLDEFYFFIDEEENYYIVSMKFKVETEQTESEYEKAVYKFFDELIESHSYLDQLKRTSDIRQTILEKALAVQRISEEAVESFQKKVSNDVDALEVKKDDGGK